MRIQSKRGVKGRLLCVCVCVCVCEGALELRFSLSGVSGEKKTMYNEFMTSDCFQ